MNKNHANSPNNIPQQQQQNQLQPKNHLTTSTYSSSSANTNTNTNGASLASSSTTSATASFSTSNGTNSVLSGSNTNTLNGKQKKKLGHREVKDGIVHYKKISTDELKKSIQFGIVHHLNEQNRFNMDRDLLMQDFQVVETIIFPKYDLFI